MTNHEDPDPGYEITTEKIEQMIDELGNMLLATALQSRSLYYPILLDMCAKLLKELVKMRGLVAQIQSSAISGGVEKEFMAVKNQVAVTYEVLTSGVTTTVKGKA